MASGGISENLHYQLAMWFPNGGVNYPLCRELAKLPWPDELSPRLHRARQRLMTRVAYYQGRMEDVLQYGACADMELRERAWACDAAIRLGKPELAIECAAKTSASDSDLSKAGLIIHAGILTAFAAEREVAGKMILDNILMMTPQRQRALLTGQGYRLLRHASVVKHALPIVEAITDSTSTPELRRTYLELLLSMPDLTLEKWQAGYKAQGPADEKANSQADKDMRRLHITALLRFGQADKAKAMLLGEGGQFTRNCLGGAWPAVGFYSDPANRKALQGRWARLRGTVMRYRDKKNKVDWFLRWDGRVFRMRNGKLDEPTGLPRGMPFCSLAWEKIGHSDNIVRLLRMDNCYILDSQSDRWKRTWLINGDDHSDGYLLDQRPEAMFLKAWAADGNPPEIGRHLRLFWRGARERVFLVDNHLWVYVKATGELVDVSGTIGRKAGLGRPAAVSWPSHQPEDSRILLLIRSEAGLWWMDNAGKLARVNLPLRDPNQWIVHDRMGRPEEGKYYCGQLAQNGGKLFIVDLKTWRVQTTGGYVGNGPSNAFASLCIFDVRPWPIHLSPILDLYQPEQTSP
jgi:hypothetical protein